MVVQVFGQTGMLGSAVVRATRERGVAMHPHQADLEIVTSGHIHAQIVINCAGLVKQRDVVDSRFMTINAVGPHRLAEACDQAGARLIHVSTDCVHSYGPADEDDLADAPGIYARSKLAGEVVRAPHTTIRTSFVGWGQRGLLHDLSGGREVRASSRLWWSGHTVDWVAGLLLDLAARPNITGLLHVPGEFQTRLQLCHLLATRFELPASIVRDDSYIADRRLISSRWYDFGLPTPPAFVDQLETMVRL